MSADLVELYAFTADYADSLARAKREGTLKIHNCITDTSGHPADTNPAPGAALPPEKPESLHPILEGGAGQLIHTYHNRQLPS